MSHNFIIGIVILLIVLSILLQIIIGIQYQNMINETDNMTATNHPALKQCKTKFANCYRLNGGVSNIPIFVDKFLNHLKWGKFSLIALQHWSGQLVLFSVFVSGTGIYIGITRGDSFLTLMPYYIISLIGLYVYFGVTSAVDIAGKRRLLKTNLIDYMENHMVKRLEILPESMRMATIEEEEIYTGNGRAGRIMPSAERVTISQEEVRRAGENKRRKLKNDEELDERENIVKEKKGAKEEGKSFGMKERQKDSENNREEIELLLRDLLS